MEKSKRKAIELQGDEVAEKKEQKSSVSYALKAIKGHSETLIKGGLISTVHDSIVCDVEPNEVERTCALFHEVFNDIPANFEKLFKRKFTLPTRCEVEYGPNLKDLTPFEHVV